MARSSSSARQLNDHDEIRQWAEERGGTPSCVRGTGGEGDIGMLRYDAFCEGVAHPFLPRLTVFLSSTLTPPLP